MSVDSIPVEIRRRRAASYRSPALADGRHDPIDSPRPRPTIHVRAIGADTVEFTGIDWAVADAIRSLGVRRMRAPKGGAWLVQQASSEDIMALLEHRGYFISYTL